MYCALVGKIVGCIGLIKSGPVGVHARHSKWSGLEDLKSDGLFDGIKPH